MSTEARRNLIQASYQTMILLGVLVSAGMTLVQAGGTDPGFHFPDNWGTNRRMTTASREPLSCTMTSAQSQFNPTEIGGSCSSGSEYRQSSRAGETATSKASRRSGSDEN